MDESKCKDQPTDEPDWKHRLHNFSKMMQEEFVKIGLIE